MQCSGAKAQPKSRHFLLKVDSRDDAEYLCHSGESASPVIAELLVGLKSLRLLDARFSRAMTHPCVDRFHPNCCENQQTQ
jgi:hypothetical protein